MSWSDLVMERRWRLGQNRSTSKSELTMDLLNRCGEFRGLPVRKQTRGNREVVRRQKAGVEEPALRAVKVDTSGV